MAKYVFVTGGVCSGLGKGITASSIALLLKAKGYKVFMQKFDPYMNADPGLLSPIQHGEVFVTADGIETDLDLGHYERFIDEELNWTSSITSGKIYSSVFEKERRGEYSGATIQIVPHISNEIKNKVYEAGMSSNADIVITEIGGTVGDIESSVMMESLRQIRLEQGKENTLFVHTTLVPYLFGSNELKTKPTQASINELRRLGIQPDVIVTRSPIKLDESARKKIALFGSIPIENIIEAIDVNNVYQIPLNFHRQKIEEIILKQFDMKVTKSDLKYWEELIDNVENLSSEVEIALVGKYTELEDAYLSVKEALKAAGYKYKTKIKINWINSEDLEKDNVNLKQVFKNVSGIIVPSGYGMRGTEGMMKAAKYARENNVPYFGIGMGMHVACIEFAKNVCGLKGACSREFSEICDDPVIDLMAQEKAIVNKGGTLRLGNYTCELKKGSKVADFYKEDAIMERHRHKYEFNNKYKSMFEEAGMIFSGVNPESDLVEIFELSKYPFYIGVQFLPEFKSRPTRPHPLFDAFIKVCLKK